MFKNHKIYPVFVLFFIYGRVSSVFATCGTINTNYTLGLYDNQWTAIYNISGANPLFCSTWSVDPFFILTGTQISRWCVWSSSGMVDMCYSPIRLNQPTSCGISSTAGSLLISTSTTGACIAGSGHSDPSIIWNIKVLNVLGWGNTNVDWTWTCGGDYHTTTSCTTPSLWLCWSAGSWLNQSFSNLSSTDSSLCANGTVSGFVMNPITTSPFYTAQYLWTCKWSPSTLAKTCSAYQTATAAPWICNAGINNQSFIYSQIKDATLCTQGIPSVTLLSPIPDTNNKWTRSCIGLWGGSTVSCSANAITNGICSTYTTNQSSIPSSLCVAGTPTTVSSLSGSYQWICNGTNGGLASSICKAPCSSSQCVMTWSTSTTSTGSITTTWSSTSSGSDGKTTPISFNLVCTDPDGCVCYNVTIVNWSRCLANTFTGISDSIISAVSVWSVCTDADGCLCNNLNTIINGAICQTDGLTGYLPGAADLSVYQAVTSGTISRRGQIDITVNYINRGPNMATWARLEYYLSPLVSKIRTTTPYGFAQVSSSGYIQTDQYQTNVLVFPLGDVWVWENGSVTISMTLNAALTDEEIINAASIASRVQDSKPLDNAQKTVLSLTKQTATNLGNYIINPLLTLHQLVQQYQTMNSWLNINPVFSDIQKGNDNYMSVMTVVRNGIFEGYQYNHARKFEWDKCTTRLESIIVLAKMMYNAGSTDVYVSRPTGTAYIDTNTLSVQSQNFINWAHERGLLSLLNPKIVKWTLYLEPNKIITQGESKKMLNAIYTRYGLLADILNDLLTDENSCLTRGEFADTISTILRGNPNIMMGYNDEFLTTIIDKTHTMSILDRRVALQNIITKLKNTTPSLLYENGYDPESLLWILEAAMDGREYNPIVSTLSLQLAQ